MVVMVTVNILCFAIILGDIRSQKEFAKDIKLIGERRNQIAEQALITQRQFVEWRQTKVPSAKAKLFADIEKQLKELER